MSREKFQSIIDAIEDGELDDYFIELREALDDRIQRRKDSVMKLVKTTFGEDARVVNGQVVTGPKDQPVPAQPPAEVVLDDGTVLAPDDPEKFALPPEGIPEPTIPGAGGDLLDSLPGEYINKGATFGSVS